MKLQGRAALITGGSRGFGRAVTEAFLKEGASVFLCARDGKTLAKTRRELDALAMPGGKVAARPADISKTREVDALVRSALKTFPALDILVNNAGIYGPLGPIEDIPWKQWVRALEINLLGPTYLCRALVPHLKRLGHGKIINLSGGGATNPMPRMSSYGASKAGFMRLSETLAEELRGTGIDVNAVAPGPLNTRFLDEVLDAGPEKVGAPFYEKARRQKQDGGAPLEKGAALCVFLASQESDGLTGKLLSALWDPWETLPRRLDELSRTDIYTLRRIVPKDRGLGWGEPPPK
ncbi:MAG: SDR family oxidoreductase [Elusimicrobia bacterium]|nr:SDR family oxidoreductase [Elusimicrobiota bacterium]